MKTSLFRLYAKCNINCFNKNYSSELYDNKYQEQEEEVTEAQEQKKIYSINMETMHVILIMKLVNSYSNVSISLFYSTIGTGLNSVESRKSTPTITVDIICKLIDNRINRLYTIFCALVTISKPVLIKTIDSLFKSHEHINYRISRLTAEEFNSSISITVTGFYPINTVIVIKDNIIENVEKVYSKKDKNLYTYNIRPASLDIHTNAILLYIDSEKTQVIYSIFIKL